MSFIEKWIKKLPLVTFLTKKSKRIILPGFESLPLYDVSVFFVEQLRKIGISMRAAAISFNILLALPAGLIFICTLVPYLPKAVHFEKELLNALAEIIRNEGTYRLLAEIIHDFFGTTRGGLLSFSFAAAIFFSSNAMMGIMLTFDRSYFESRSTKFLAKRRTAILLTSLLIILVLATIILLATQAPVRSYLLRKLNWDIPIIQWAFQAFRWLTIILLNFFTIAFIYRYAPAIKNRWKLFSPGAILASVLTITTTWIFGIWVNNFGQYNQVYGSIGTVLIVMNLVYINSLVLIIGFEVNVSITSIKSQSIQRQKEEDLADEGENESDIQAKTTAN